MTKLEALVIKNKEQFSDIEKSLGYSFKDQRLLQEAFFHSSYVYEQGGDILRDNETLEFLGDAALDLSVGHKLYLAYPRMDEGNLTQLRSALVKEDHLATMARSLKLGNYLLLGKGENFSNGREKDSILSCTFEAVIGAIFLDGGYAEVDLFVARIVEPWFDDRRQAMGQADSKSKLQEMLQKIFSEGPKYHLEKSSGPDHDKTFKVSVKFRGQVLAFGEAKNKKQAEQLAAAQAIADFASFGFN